VQSKWLDQSIGKRTIDEGLIIGIHRAHVPPDGGNRADSACGICLASNSLSTGGKYVSVAAGTRIVRALIDDNAFSKSPAKRGCAEISLCSQVQT